MLRLPTTSLNIISPRNLLVEPIASSSSRLLVIIPLTSSFFVLNSPWRLRDSVVDFLRRLGLVESFGLFDPSSLIFVPEVEGSSLGIVLWRFMVDQLILNIGISMSGKGSMTAGYLFCFCKRKCSLGFTRNLIRFCLFGFLFSCFLFSSFRVYSRSRFLI